MPIIILTICWLLGLWASSTLAGGSVPLSAWVASAAASFILMLPVRARWPDAGWALACALLFCAGGARGLAAAPAEACLLPDALCAYNDSGRPVTLVGIVSAEPTPRNTRQLVQVAVSTLQTGGAIQSVSDSLVATVPRFPALQYGTAITLTGQLETPFESAEFNYKEHLARQGVYSTMSFPFVQTGDGFHGNTFRHTLIQFKQQLAGTINRSVPAPEAALLRAILLGDRTDLPDETVDSFRNSGLAHLIAISGFHVSLILVGAVSLLDLFMTKRRAALLTLLVLVGYALLVGLRPSVLRATLMGAAWLIGQRWLGRRASATGALALVVLVITAFDPLLLFDAGFQLSATATLGIALFARPMSDKLTQRVGEKWASSSIGRTTISLIAVSLAAQLLTLPLVAWHFGQIAPLGLLANLLVVPLQPLSLLLGAGAALAGSVLEPLGVVVGWLAWLPLRLTLLLTEALATLPGASVSVRVNSATVVASYAAIATGAWYRQQASERRALVREQLGQHLGRQGVLVGLTLCTCLIANWALTLPDGHLHIAFFDVGQGDATLIITPSGRKILVDAGASPSAIVSHLGRVLPFHDRTIDLVIATHPDSDHIGGLPGVLSRYRVEQMWVNTTNHDTPIYKEVAALIGENETPLHVARVGEQIDVEDGVQLAVLHPSDVFDDNSRNNNSIVLRLVYDNFSLLLTGDAEASAEQALLLRTAQLASVVYKAGHHGSNTSSSAPFLDAVQPQIAIISAGTDNRFNHPHPDVLGRLAARGIAVLDTRQNSSITLGSDGESMWWTGNKRSP